MLTAPRMVRTERAVRPCLPITLPTSWGATRSFSTVFSSRSTESTSTAAGSSTRARAISRTSSSTATISCWVMHLPLTVRVRARTGRAGARILTAQAKKSQQVCGFGPMSAPVRHRSAGKGNSGRDRGRCGVLGHQLFHDGRELRANAAPVGDALVLQVDSGRIGAGIVGAYDFDGTAIAGAVLFNNHDPVIRLLAGAKAR